ncbi:hypothetical protein [Alicyclobacillus sendaiensis]|uniref:hypothetical protein n=1 Tax=Alicyclobacillus sendaiensis TaxID=192387 RepID=UPI000A8897D4|nr:hypothetical protein [Alicyclobacillus sendaiensis]
MMALDVPLRGVLEALWMSCVYTYLDLALLRRPHPSWPGLLLGGAWFGGLYPACSGVGLARALRSRLAGR